ncbi:hypothetical protein [Bartonella quintana]|uniref:hypothetical protein n=1 Tax=Bartonella quintana TaxID=803 RepID=UPI00027FCCE2|nr:hypothetical protein [Bartonella quintana]AFR26109.1 hypothetical protein RM11_0370 [Bartonella quintana RM-11]
MFDSRLVYNLDDSTPIYSRAYSVIDFDYHVNIVGLQGAVMGEEGRAMGGYNSDKVHFRCGLIGAGGGFLGGVMLGSLQSKPESVDSNL